MDAYGCGEYWEATGRGREIFLWSCCVDEVTVNNIAVLSESGNTWEPLAGGGVQSRSPELSEEQGVKTFCVVSDRLYVGGTFDQVRVQ